MMQSSCPSNTWRKTWAYAGLGIAALVSAQACGGDTAFEFDETLRVESGALAGTLSFDPMPPRVGYSAATVVLLDAEGQPVTDAQVLFSPWMPAHGHGSTDVEALGDGTGAYTADRVRLHMSGLWDLRVYVLADGQESELVGSIEVP